MYRYPLNPPEPVSYTHLQSLKRPKMKINRYGSATYARSSDRELVQSEVLRMREGLNDIAKTYLQARVIPVTGVELRTSSITLRVGKNTQISLEPLPYNANPVTWQFRSCLLYTSRCV